jgi:hypothetical protein
MGKLELLRVQPSVANGRRRANPLEGLPGDRLAWVGWRTHKPTLVAQFTCFREGYVYGEPGKPALESVMRFGTPTCELTLEVQKLWRVGYDAAVALGVPRPGSRRKPSDPLPKRGFAELRLGAFDSTASPPIRLLSRLVLLGSTSESLVRTKQLLQSAPLP